MDPTLSEIGTLETKADAGTGERGLVKLWLDAIDLAEKREEKWRKKAEQVEKRWRAESDDNNKGSLFNILHTNQETLEPALYNATPTPDVRRRFGDQDPLGKLGAQVLERGLAFSIDAYDFDATMHGIVHDGLLVGRGVGRVRYVPRMADGSVAWEQVECDLIDWKDFVVGPGRRWSEVPWIAFKHRLTREELVTTFGAVGNQVDLDIVIDGAEAKDGNVVPEIFKRGLVYEIHDKQERKILFIAKSIKEKPLKSEDDLLKLKDFFPVPRPYYDVADPNSLIPAVPYTFYENQARELDRLTARINALIQVIKWRGARSGLEEFEKIADAKDGELVPIQNWQQLMASGGLDKAFWLMPIEQAIKVLEGLYEARERIKQVIFEITGVADIMRGQTDPDETLGAQQIKTQWGTLRLQRRQKEVQRIARDLMRLKAELIAEKFSVETLAMMTGLQLPTAEQKQQAQMAAQQMQGQVGQDGQPMAPPAEVQQLLQSPSWDDVLGLIRNDGPRLYRIDIETDSTIEPDQVQAQKSMAEFVQGTASFMEAMGPGIQAGMVPPDVAIDVYTGMARQFKLGKQAEDALDRWSQKAQELAQNPPPQPDPDAEAKAKVAIEEKKLALQAQSEERKAALEDQRMQREVEMEERRFAVEQEREERRMMLEREKMGQELAFKRENATMDQAINAYNADQDRAASVQTEREKLQVQREGQGEPAEAAEVQQSLANIEAMVTTLAEQVKAIVPVVEKLADDAKDLAEPVEFIYRDGRLAGRKQGRKTQSLKFGPDGRAVGMQ